MPRIEITPSVYLDKISTADTERLAQIANDPVFRKNMGDTFPYPYTLDDAKWFVDNCAKEWEKEYGERNYGIYVDGMYAWNLGRHQKKRWRELFNVHLWYWIWKEYRWKWYMTKILAIVLEEINKDIPDRHRIYAKVVASNPGSRKVLEKNWFVLEGTEREVHRYEDEWHDKWILSILKSEFDSK